MTLLESIQSEIKAAGGRWTLAHRIIEESPGWFTIQDRRRARENATRAAARRRFAANMKRSERRWSKEDTAYLLEKYGTMKGSQLGRILNRSAEACQKKFFLTASPERIAMLPKLNKGENYG